MFIAAAFTAQIATQHIPGFSRLIANRAYRAVTLIFSRRPVATLSCSAAMSRSSERHQRNPIMAGYSAARSESISIGTTIGQASAYTA